MQTRLNNGRQVVIRDGQRRESSQRCTFYEVLPSRPSDAAVAVQIDPGAHIDPAASTTHRAAGPSASRSSRTRCASQ